MPPYDPVSAILCRAVAREEQYEFIRYFETVEMNAHAAVGDVDNEAVARRRVVPELDLRETFEGIARLAAFLFGPR
jgi:hypothetical protein